MHVRALLFDDELDLLRVRETCLQLDPFLQHQKTVLWCPLIEQLWYKEVACP